MPEGYPLPSIDSEGNKIKEGDIIKINIIPNSLLADYLSDDEKKVVLACEGKEMKIEDIDKYGFIWVQGVLLHTDDEYNTQSFSIEPKYVSKIH